AFLFPLELPLMEKSQARRKKRYYGGGLVDLRSKGGSRARFIVVFEETGQLVLVVEAGVEMFSHGPGALIAPASVQALVGRIIESLLLQRPFQLPVNFGHEREARKTLAHAPGCRRPEKGSTLAPGAFEDVGQDEHGHVAADAVALAGDLQEFADHRFLRGGVG